MRGWIALVLFVLVALFAVTHHDPNASNRILVEPVVPVAASMILCEKRQLQGRQHTLNPHAPPKKRRQELITVCVEVPADGHLPRGPVSYKAMRQPLTIA